MAEQKIKVKVRQFAYLDYSDLNTRVFEVFSSFRADFAKALKERQVVELKAIGGKEIGLDMIILASQIFNAENKKLGVEKQVFVIPLEKEDNKYTKTDSKSVELNGKKQKFTCFSLEVLTGEQVEIEEVKLPSKLEKRIVGKKSADKTQAEPASDGKAQSEPASSDKEEANDSLLFDLSDLLVAKFKIGNKERVAIESAIAAILERYSIQKKN